MNALLLLSLFTRAAAAAPADVVRYMDENTFVRVAYACREKEEGPRLRLTKELADDGRPWENPTFMRFQLEGGSGEYLNWDKCRGGDWYRMEGRLKVLSTDPLRLEERKTLEKRCKTEPTGRWRGWLFQKSYRYELVEDDDILPGKLLLHETLEGFNEGCPLHDMWWLAVPVS